MKWLAVVVLLSIGWSTGAGTYEGEVLLVIKQSLNDTNFLLEDWEEDSYMDPCNSWSHVTCVSGDHVAALTLVNMNFSGTISPQIGQLQFLTNLVLEGNSLTGEIPPQLGNVTSLRILNLASNQLTGEIPNTLGQLSDLQYLVLRNNKLRGEIPVSIAKIPNLIELDLSSNNLSGQIPTSFFQIHKYDFTGNHVNCSANSSLPCVFTSSSSSGSSKRSKTGILARIIGGGGVIMLVLVLLFLLCQSRHRGNKKEVFIDVSGEDDLKIAFGQLKRFSLRELQLATDDFSENNFLGRGGFGKVYKGVLADNTKVAVKQMNHYYSPIGEEAFLREVEIISVAIHRNLLRLIGFCVTPSERLLVYPYMQNLSLAYRLRELNPTEKPLDWPARKNVAIGVARGLEYLHENCNTKFIHRDVKAANVLLDENFEAVVSDFGLAKLVDVMFTHLTSKVRGSIGHIPPEYLSTGKFSEKTDVFGYGITLLEIVTGQHAVDSSVLEDPYLVNRVRKLHRENRLDAIIDGNLKQTYDAKEVEAMIQVALLCTQASAEDRPKMREIVHMLEGERLDERWEEWQQVEVMMPRGPEWAEDSIYNQNAIELSVEDDLGVS